MPVSSPSAATASSCSASRSGVDQVGLGDDRDLRRTPHLGQLVDDEPVAGADLLVGREAERRPRRPRPRSCVTRSLSRSPSSVRGRCRPGVSTRTSCASGRCTMPRTTVPGGLRARGGDGHLRPDQRVGQGRLAGVGPADEGGEAAAEVRHPGIVSSRGVGARTVLGGRLGGAHLGSVGLRGVGTRGRRGGAGRVVGAVGAPSLRQGRSRSRRPPHRCRGPSGLTRHPSGCAQDAAVWPWCPCRSCRDRRGRGPWEAWSACRTRALAWARPGRPRRGPPRGARCGSSWRARRADGRGGRTGRAGPAGPAGLAGGRSARPGRAGHRGRSAAGRVTVRALAGLRRAGLRPTRRGARAGAVLAGRGADRAAGHRRVADRAREAEREVLLGEVRDGALHRCGQLVGHRGRTGEAQPGHGGGGESGHRPPGAEPDAGRRGRCRAGCRCGGAGRRAAARARRSARGPAARRTTANSSRRAASSSIPPSRNSCASASMSAITGRVLTGPPPRGPSGCAARGGPGAAAA